MQCPKCPSQDIKVAFVVHYDANERGEPIEGTEEKEQVDWCCGECEYDSTYWMDFSTLGKGGGNAGE